MSTPRKNFPQLIEKANILTGVGILLTIVPLGMCLVSYITSAGAPPFDQLKALGWAFFVTIALLPIGFLLFAFSLGWMVLLKREQKRTSHLYEDEDDEEAEKTELS